MLKYILGSSKGCWLYTIVSEIGKAVAKSYWTLIIQENEQIHGGGGEAP